MAGVTQRKVLPAHARRHNRSLIVRLLLRDGPQSRAELSRATELTAATVSDLVGHLVAEGIVEERGRRSTGTGKPGTLLGIVADARHTVSLDLSDQNQFVGGVVNLVGKVVDRRELARDGRTGDEAVALAAQLAADLLAAAAAAGPVLGVGVGSPGVVALDGVVRESSNLRWHDRGLGAELHARLGVPVHVVNDANAAALGELRFGDSPHANLLLVKIGLGVGAGLVLEGRLVGGEDCAAGEIGHVVVDIDGHRCACGNRGCLETVVGGPRLRQRMDEQRDASGRAEVRADAGDRLGTALAPVVSMLNLSEVLLSGPGDLLDEPFPQATVAAIRRRTIPQVGDRLAARHGSTGPDDVLLGATAVVLEHELGVL